MFSTLWRLNLCILTPFILSSASALGLDGTRILSVGKTDTWQSNKIIIYVSVFMVNCILGKISCAIKNLNFESFFSGFFSRRAREHPRNFVKTAVPVSVFGCHIYNQNWWAFLEYPIFIALQNECFLGYTGISLSVCLCFHWSVYKILVILCCKLLL